MLPSIREATLPDRYIAAQHALAECKKIDECKDWADKAAALASYARQAEDTTLERMAQRIRARAVRRCGELIRLQKAAGLLSPGRRNLNEVSEDAYPSTREGLKGRSVTENAKPTFREVGISHKFSHQAQRVAAIPEPEFEAAVESADPPSISQLAAMGAPPKPETDQVAIRIAENSRRPGFAAFTQASGRLRDFAAFCRVTDPAFAAGGGFPEEVAEVRVDIATIDQWMDRFAVNLKGVE